MKIEGTLVMDVRFEIQSQPTEREREWLGLAQCEREWLREQLQPRLPNLPRPLTRRTSAWSALRHHHGGVGSRPQYCMRS